MDVEDAVELAAEREAAAADAFATADADGSGFIDRSELEAVLLASEGARVKEFVDSAFAISDSEGDGKLSFEEFVVAFNHMTDWLHERQVSEKVASMHKSLEEATREATRLRAENQALKMSTSLGRKGRSKVPRVGDSVISHHIRSNFYNAKIVRFNAEDRTFEVAWDDGDTTATVQPYERVCLDTPPSPGTVAVGSMVIFPARKYQFQGQTGLQLYKEGRVMDMRKEGQSITYIVALIEAPGGDGVKERLGPARPCTLNELRVCANIFDLLQEDAATHAGDQAANEGSSTECDVFVSCVAADLATAMRLGHEKAANPQDLVANLAHRGWRVLTDTGHEAEATTSLAGLKKAKVVVCCLSNAYSRSVHAVQVLQYAKKTLKKNVVPLIVGGSDEDWSFMESLVGLLIAGDLYVDFRQRDKHEAKVAELSTTVEGLLSVKGGDGTAAGRSRAVDGDGASEASDGGHAPERSGKGARRDVFVSYCWHNSRQAHLASQVPAQKSSDFADPRAVAASLKAAGLKTWLDMEVLGGGSGLFGDIAKGIKHARVVVVCLSSEYAASENCVMELQYALKVLRKPFIPVVVGKDDAWQETVCGLLTGSAPTTVDLNARAVDEGTYEEAVADLVELVRQVVATTPKRDVEAKTQIKAHIRENAGPAVGDHVIGKYGTKEYYPATVVGWEASTRVFELQWDDNDSRQRQKPYEDVCLDKPPDPEDVGVGSVVIFQAGTYSHNGSDPLPKYSRGTIERINRRAGENGEDLFTLRRVDYNSDEDSYHVPLEKIRIHGNLMAALTLGNASAPTRGGGRGDAHAGAAQGQGQSQAEPGQAADDDDERQQRDDDSSSFWSDTDSADDDSWSESD